MQALPAVRRLLGTSLHPLSLDEFPTVTLLAWLSMTWSRKECRSAACRFLPQTLRFHTHALEVYAEVDFSKQRALNAHLGGQTPLPCHPSHVFRFPIAPTFPCNCECAQCLLVFSALYPPSRCPLQVGSSPGLNHVAHVTGMHDTCG